MHLSKAWLCVLWMFTCHAATAQYNFKGTVRDSVSGQPLANVRVSARGHVCWTAENGRFAVTLPSDTVTLSVSRIGYNKKNVSAVADQMLVVCLIPGPVNLREITVTPALHDASFHTLASIDLNLRPVATSQDLMRLVPGLFIAQHMGGGKAEQIFIRGFDADHGSDLNVSVDGMPVNMVSHIHGQGYADLHFLIPETVSTFAYGKGPYYPDFGDFTTAGYLSYQTKEAIAHSMISAESGLFDTYRTMALVNLLDSSARRNGENAYAAGEYNFTDGPFRLPEKYKRANLFVRYSRRLGQNSKLSLSASSFSTSWRASGEIPERAVAPHTTAVDASGRPYLVPESPRPIDRFGTLDSAQGGKSTRLNARLGLYSDLKNNWVMENGAYYSHYTFLLHVNSTFFARDSIHGDERQQQEARDMVAYRGMLQHTSYFGPATLSSKIGLETRFDRTYGSDYSLVTADYQLLKPISHGDVRQNNSAVYLEETVEAGKWLFSAGARLDYFTFVFRDSAKQQAPVSPKLNAAYAATDKLEVYLKSGKGFHSNNAIVAVSNAGINSIPAAYGTDLGLIWKPFPRVYIDAALWCLYLRQEFVYTDNGDIAPGGRTFRKGVDLSARLQLADWLFADVDLNLARSSFVDSAGGYNYLPLAPAFSSTGGLDFKIRNGFNGGISYRCLGSRPGNNMNTLKADGYFITDLKMNYTTKRYEIGLSVENLLNRSWKEFEAEEVSRLKSEAVPVDQMSFTPGTPFFAKIRFAIFL